jgi:uncharacterized protein
LNYINKHIEQIRLLCTKYHVAKLYAFGSVLTNAFTNTSDIDLIVDFDAMSVEKYADNYFDFKFSLQDLLKRNIDFGGKEHQKPLFQAKHSNKKTGCLWIMNSKHGFMTL